ncbi:hypothetical protein B0H17DRAFT_1209860 [Mycena rosella]|uniref:Uncharacterized protein n=1 Tax=Mycena rosella TaxID=1033263 RepID=A0AAD7CXX1_MYCRO|nr:hypothetical protein B0H17DRAFT_1209860 [Mycena rosella]
MVQDGNNLGADNLGLDLYKTLDHSKDFTRYLPSTDSAIFATALSRNIEIGDTRFSLVLLGRLLMFNMYSEILQAEGITEEHKRRWLLFQLMPQLPGDLSYDLFTDLKILAGKLEPDHAQDLIAVMFSKLRRIHGTQFRLFYVIDEAQIASRAHTSAFQQDGKGYPLLRQIIQTWITKSRPDETSFVVSGTDIPKDGFESAPFASSLRWSSDTGGFDNEDDHRRYISGFLTPAYVKSPAGQMHRSTDALLKALLLDGFRTSHELLNDYMETTTTYRPTDYDDDEPFRHPIDVKLLELNSNFFTNSPQLMSTIQRVLFHYLAAARHPSPFSEDLTPLVSAAFGRFIDGNLSHGRAHVPHPSRALARPTPESETDSSHNCLAILRHHRENFTSRFLTSFMAFYLIRAFDHGATLSKVFSFPDQLPVLNWVEQIAELLD